MIWNCTYLEYDETVPWWVTMNRCSSCMLLSGSCAERSLSSWNMCDSKRSTDTRLKLHAYTRRLEHYVYIPTSSLYESKMYKQVLCHKKFMHFGGVLVNSIFDSTRNVRSTMFLPADMAHIIHHHSLLYFHPPDKRQRQTLKDKKYFSL